MKVIFTWLGWLVAFGVWNWFFPGEREVYRSMIAEHSLHLSWMFYVIGCGVIYMVYGLNAIDQWVRRPVLRFGKYVECAGPGLCFIEPLFNTTLNDIPVNDIVTEIEVEHVQTKDNVSVSLVLVMTTQIIEAQIRDAVVSVEDVASAVEERALTSTTDEAAKEELDHLLAERDGFSKKVKDVILERIKGWGMQVKAIEIKGLKINDPEVEKAIAMKARAKKEGEAELARADYQKRVAERLKEAAAMYDDSTWRLKGMETMLELCRSGQNNTILIPTDLPSALMASPALMRNHASQTAQPTGKQ